MAVLLLIFGFALARWVLATAGLPEAERPAALRHRPVVVAGIAAGVLMMVAGAVVLVRLLARALPQ